ncbi:nuclear transport factor 2 [filamentous cyanobacterium CCP5]|nr:nuclear transport factor 2 [filamentous cyanobacterium CCP5]
MTAAIDLPASFHREPTIHRYFESFNRQEFTTTASLFAPDGALLAPFEDPVVGYAAILDYLQREAPGMEANPRGLETTADVDAEADDLKGHRQIIVKGSVKAVVFNVNVAWTFQLDADDRIQRVRVKLLASLEDLIQFRPQPVGEKP